MGNALSSSKLDAACAAIAKAQQSDVIFFNGPTQRVQADKFLDAILSRRRRENVLLVLVTQGGSAESAYRIARGLQESY